MRLRTQALDCLYLNWAVPLTTAPALPAPLRYEIHRWRDEDYVFASALLYRLSGLHPRRLPFLRLSYPQMSFRLYVLDGDGVPSVLFRRTLVPFWIVPMSRALGRQPATGARFVYPPPALERPTGGWTWSIRRRRRLEVDGRPGSPRIGPGPSLGSWERTVEYIRRRPRGYVMRERRLRAINRSHPRVEVWPLEVEVRNAGLVAECLQGVDGDSLLFPHSAWVCPEIPIVFELSKAITLPLPRGELARAESC